MSSDSDEDDTEAEIESATSGNSVEISTVSTTAILNEIKPVCQQQVGECVHAMLFRIIFNYSLTLHDNGF